MEFKAPAIRSSDVRHRAVRPVSQQRGRIEHIWILALALIAVAGAFVLDLSAEGTIYFTLGDGGWKVQLPETCMSQRIFGISCPGCGLTRSFVAMAHGEFDLAIQANPVGPVLFVLCWLQIPYRILRYLGYSLSVDAGGRLSRPADLIIWILLCGLILMWLLRSVLESMN